jgi:hypothetical protein
VGSIVKRNRYVAAKISLYGVVKTTVRKDRCSP